MSSVAIEIAAPSEASVTPPELERALVDACSAAVRNGDCVLERGPSETPRTAIAIVRWDADEHHVHIDLGTKEHDEPRWNSRDLTFSDSDARMERWRTAGLTVATLASEIAAKAAEPVERPTPPEPQPDTQKPSPKPALHVAGASGASPTFWVDVGGLVGSGVDAGPPRLGVWVDVGARLPGGPLIAFLGADYAGARTSKDLSVQWLTAAAGVGARVGATGNGLAIEPTLALAVERDQASASDGTRSDSDGILTFGGRAKVTAVWQLGLVSPVVGAEGWLNAAPVQILVHDRFAAAASRGGAAVVFGIRARIE